MKLAKNLYALSGTTAAGLSLAAFGDRTFAATTDFSPTGSQIHPTGGATFTSTNADFKQQFAKVAGEILQIVLLIAGVLAVFYLVWSGIQYITSGGSPDKAKTARGGIINAIIGIVIIVAAFFIVRYAVGLGNTATSTSNTTTTSDLTQNQRNVYDDCINQLTLAQQSDKTQTDACHSTAANSPK